MHINKFNSQTTRTILSASRETLASVRSEHCEGTDNARLLYVERCLPTDRSSLPTVP